MSSLSEIVQVGQDVYVAFAFYWPRSLTQTVISTSIKVKLGLWNLSRPGIWLKFGL